MKTGFFDDVELTEYLKIADTMLVGNIPGENKLNHKFSKRFLRKMNRLLRYERKPVWARNVTSWTKKAAIIFLCTVGVLYASTMNVEAYWQKTIEVIVNVYQELTSIRSERIEGSADEGISPVYPGYVPEGFTVSEEILDTIGLYIFYEKENEFIVYNQMITGGETILDTEDAVVEKIIVDGVEILAIQKSDGCIFHWFYNTEEYCLTSNMLNDEALKMVESIIEKKFRDF